VRRAVNTGANCFRRLRLRGPEPQGLASGRACIDHSIWKPHIHHANRSAFMPKPKNVIGESLGTRLFQPRTGFTRRGNRETGSQAICAHTASDLADLKRYAVGIS